MFAANHNHDHEKWRNDSSTARRRPRDRQTFRLKIQLPNQSLRPKQQHGTKQQRHQQEENAYATRQPHHTSRGIERSKAP